MKAEGYDEKLSKALKRSYMKKEKQKEKAQERYNDALQYLHEGWNNINGKTLDITGALRIAAGLKDK